MEKAFHEGNKRKSVREGEEEAERTEGRKNKKRGSKKGNKREGKRYGDTQKKDWRNEYEGFSMSLVVGYGKGRDDRKVEKR